MRRCDARDAIRVLPATRREGEREEGRGNTPRDRSFEIRSRIGRVTEAKLPNPRAIARVGRATCARRAHKNRTDRDSEGKEGIPTLSSDFPPQVRRRTGDGGSARVGVGSEPGGGEGGGGSGRSVNAF